MTAKATKRPSSNTGKVLVVAETEIGDTVQMVYQLKGTLDVTPKSADVECLNSAFLGREPAELQLVCQRRTGSQRCTLVRWRFQTGEAEGI